VRGSEKRAGANVEQAIKKPGGREKDEHTTGGSQRAGKEDLIEKDTADL